MPPDIKIETSDSLRAALAACLRALLGVEYALAQCPCCFVWHRHPIGQPHRSGCDLDVALSAAGLKTREERDAAREKAR